MTLTLSKNMTPAEKQNKIAQMSDAAKMARQAKLLKIKEKRKRIREQLGKDVMNLDKSPIDLQKAWRDE